ncbi:hypothetical protein CCASP_04240 [Corynebacterium caspium DSM 44850]|nr:hypothetical protein CCASP_04240 [Corynebacterium caspium DSM 44850]
MVCAFEHVGVLDVALDDVTQRSPVWFGQCCGTQWRVDAGVGEAVDELALHPLVELGDEPSQCGLVEEFL